jgi:hypothetical protein
VETPIATTAHHDNPLAPLVALSGHANDAKQCLLSSASTKTDVQSLSASWKATLKVNCPYCGEMHEISVRETYINGALSDAADRLRQVI